MDNETEFIKLTISGTLFSGFSCSVPKNWALLQAKKEDLIINVRLELVSLLKRHDMHVLVEKARDIELHIHCFYGFDSKEIFICECPPP